MTTGSTVTPAGADAALRGESAGLSLGGSRTLLFDISGIDLAARRFDREGIARCNPHRGQMALLDYVVWHSDDFKQGVGLKHVREDEFWVPGHFPGSPMLPGVLQIEIAAQLASFLYNARFPKPKIAAFIKMEEATFRNKVVPGDDLYVICQETKFTAKRFASSLQGLVDGKLVFEANIVGMAIEMA